MQKQCLALLVLAGILLHKTVANELVDNDVERERRLLGGLLGGGGEGGGGGGLLGSVLGGGKGGGLLGGVLGGVLGGGKSGGLLGGLLGGGKGGGLLGGLLGGGKGGGLLGGLLGGGKGGGLLGGLLGGEGGLLGGLLGGEGGGLLGGLLGGKDGLLQILNALICLIEELGLNVVLGLLQGLGVDKMLGLNELACQEGGKSLVSLLLSKDGLIPLGIVDEVLCLVKQVGIPSAVELLDDIGLEKVLGLRNITCPDGVPLLEPGSTAAGLLETLLSVLPVDVINEAGIDSVLKLDKLLTQAGVKDLKGFVQKVLCLIKQIGLRAVVDSLEIVGVNGIFQLDDISCANKTAVVGADVKAGVDVGDVLPQLLRVVGLEQVATLIVDIGLGRLLRLGGFLVVNGTVQLPVFQQILCISTSVGVTVVLNLVEAISLQKVLELTSIICPNGQALMFPPNVKPEFLVDLLGTCYKGQLSSCLESLAKAFADNGDSVCPFCNKIAMNAIVQECTNKCNNP